MGMRAGLIYKAKSGISTLTSVQWSTLTDQSLGHFAANSQAAEADLKDLFKTITDNYDHISALEIDDTPADKHSLSFGVVKAVSGHKRKDGSLEYYQFDNAQDAMEDYLDGHSVGAMFNEANPERVTFYFISNETRELETRNAGISALAKFYNDVDNKSDKLKKFPFRNM